MFVLFNNQKEFIGYSDQLPPSIQYYHNIDGGFDINKDFWDGDYENGSMKKIETQKLNEFELESDFVNKVKALYNTETSHLLCIKQLGKIAEYINLFDPTFKEMWVELQPLFNKYDNIIETLKNIDKLEKKEETYEKIKNVL
jgi:Golgi nucleoside diphosphatase